MSYTFSNDGDVNGPQGGYNAWAVKFNWMNAAVEMSGRQQNHYAYSIQQTTDRGYIAAGAIVKDCIHKGPYKYEALLAAAYVIY